MIIRILTEVFDMLYHSPAWLLLLLVLNLLGVYLEWCGVTAKKVVAILVFLSTIVYPFIGKVGDVMYDQPNPKIIIVLIGFVIGVFAFGLHGAFVLAWRAKFPTLPKV